MDAKSLFSRKKMATVNGGSMSLGRECAACGCSERLYKLENGIRVHTGNNFFSFPKSQAEIKVWCSLIKRQHGRDGFKVTNATRICSKHFLAKDIYRPPGGTKSRLINNAKPLLHSWNNFQVEKVPRKAPMQRLSPRKKCRLSLESENIASNVSEIDFDIVDGQSSNSKDNNKRVEDLMKEKEELITKLQQLENLHCEPPSFKEHVMSSDKNCNHYTGMPSTEILTALLDFIDPGIDGANIILYNSRETKGDDTRGRKRIFSPLESFIVTLVRLRRNFDVKHLAYLFNASEGTICNTINTWINFLYLKLGTINIWPSKEQIQKYMPESMSQKYPHVKCIIDCVEFKIAVPNSLFLHKMMYSDYKSHTTVKALVGIAPGGGFNFISQIYPGSVSDKDMVLKSGLLNKELWEYGDGIMADRGFTIQEYLTPLGVDLVIPSFLKGREQLTEAEVVKSQQIANERIHVERMIQRLKCYHIFDRVVPLNMLGSLNQIITVCALLSNFQEPILKNTS